MKISAEISLSDIYIPIEKELDQFKRLLKEELQSKDPFFAKLNQHILKSLGKHLRPALVLLTAKITGDKKDRHALLACAVELMHTATLVHDDIIDHAALRRHQATINVKWGNNVSIVCGDYLYAKSLDLISRIGDSEVSHILAGCALAMCEGEMRQIRLRNQLPHSVKVYLDIIEKKTASLFEASCYSGAYLGTRQDNKTVRALARYGFCLGMTFQIIDDFLDLFGNTERLGKGTGTDLESSDMTLPFIYLVKSLSHDERGKIMSQLNGDHKRRYAKVRQIADERGISKKILAKANHYAQRALDTLKDIGTSPFKTSLEHLVHYSLKRDC